MKRYFNPLLFSVIALIGMGCVGTRHLKEGEYLLYNQKIEHQLNNHSDQLKRQLVQKPNRRILKLPITPYTYLYYQGQKSYDQTELGAKLEALDAKYEAKLKAATSTQKVNRLNRKKNKKVSAVEKSLNEGNLLMRWGEPLTVFDSIMADRSRRSLEIYMKSNGWFNAFADYEVKYDEKLAKVNYVLAPGPRYRIDSISYNIPDTAIHTLVLNASSNSKIKVKNPYRQDDLSAERTRIDDLLQNNGYFDFSRQYIMYKVDTTMGDRMVHIQLNILNPNQKDRHKSFAIDSVIFTVESSPSNRKDVFEPFEYKNVTYNFSDRYYSKKVLGRRIDLNPGKPYSKQRTLNTQRELAGMDMYKFVNINYDTTANRFQANIFVSPLNRYQWTIEAGLTVTQALPGPFASISLKQRNVFNTFGILEVGGNIGVEGVAAASNPNDILASLEAGANVSLTFPRFFLPFSDETKQKLGFYNPKSIVRIGLNITDRPEYNRSNLSASNSYTWQPKENLLFDFQFLEVALVRTNYLDSAYFERLRELEQNGNNLINSFKPSFISNQRFTRSVNKNNYGRGYSNSSYFSIAAEPGGTFTNLWMRDFFASDSLEIYAYVKLDTDYRKIFKATQNKAWAFRIRSGIAIPYGENGLLPYEKYFFSGGSISNRAWRPRRLGPGSFDHIEEDGQVSYQFEQQGEIIIESSIEFRQKILGFLHWAAFVDAGNIWMIKEDKARPGAQFKFNSFYREIAVGAGLGLRLDFSFFIMRFDAAAKIVDPARPLGKRFILSNGFNDAPFNNPSRTEPIVYTLSIGYPF